jgi:hypothetical protein
LEDSPSLATIGQILAVISDGKLAKVVEWFGSKLHLLVDVKHEVALATRSRRCKKRCCPHHGGGLRTG